MTILGKPALIGITGEKYSGKSTIARFLHDTFGYARIRFADPLKDMLRAIGLTDYELEGDGKELPCEILAGHTPRYAMQSLGTEWGRERISREFWSEAWAHRADRGPGGFVVAEDLRFPNEEFRIRLMGGVIWRVERPGYGSQDDHPSETEGRHIRADKTFTNQTSIEDLLWKVRKEIDTPTEDS
jgi:hypothetical protein